MKRVDDRFDVRLEQTSIDLRKDVADRLAFVRKFDGERGLELRDQLRDDLGTEVCEVR